MVSTSALLGRWVMLLSGLPGNSGCCRGRWKHPAPRLGRQRGRSGAGRAAWFPQGEAVPAAGGVRHVCGGRSPVPMFSGTVEQVSGRLC